MRARVRDSLRPRCGHALVLQQPLPPALPPCMLAPAPMHKQSIKVPSPEPQSQTLDAQQTMGSKQCNASIRYIKACCSQCSARGFHACLQIETSCLGARNGSKLAATAGWLASARLHAYMKMHDNTHAHKSLMSWFGHSVTHTSSN